MTKTLLQYAQEKDPRRGFACAYCDDIYRDKLCALVIFDSEIWEIHSRAGDMVQFRLQFWADKVSQYPDLQPFDNVSKALYLLLQTLKKDDLLLYLDSHFSYLSDTKSGRQAIWRQYFTLSAKLCGHSEKLAPQCAEMIINAINGDFALNGHLLNSLNTALKMDASKERTNYINDLLFLRLAKKAKYFSDIYNETPRKLGLFAQFQLFIGRLTSNL